jgi:hypothetical protein
MLAVSTDQTPHPGQVWRSPTGRPMLYVRTEQRPGASGPQHLFVETHDRVLMERWLPADQALPDELELALDPEAHERATAATNLLTWAHREKDALAAAMQAAVPLVPVSTGHELRRVYREALLG